MIIIIIILKKRWLAVDGLVTREFERKADDDAPLDIVEDCKFDVQ